MVNEVLEELDKIGAEKVYKILLAYTAKRISLMYWNHSKDTTTKGKLANDFVGEAILKAIDNNGEKWNRENCPKLVNYLIGLISNQLSNSVSSSENKLGINIDLHEEEGNLKDSNSSASKKLDEIDDLTEWKIKLEKYKKIVDDLVKNDDDIIQFVFDEMIEGFQSEVIASRLEIDVKEVYKYTRRIKLAIKKKCQNEG